MEFSLQFYWDSVALLCLHLLIQQCLILEMHCWRVVYFKVLSNRWEVHRHVVVWSQELPCKNYPMTGTVLFDYNHPPGGQISFNIFSFDDVKFFWQNCTIFNNSLHPKPRHCWSTWVHPYSSEGFQMVPKALQGLLWVGKAQHDKHQGLSNSTKSIARAILGWESSTWQISRASQWYQKHCKGYCGLGKVNMTNKQNKPTTFHNRQL